MMGFVNQSYLFILMIPWEEFKSYLKRLVLKYRKPDQNF